MVLDFVSTIDQQVVFESMKAWADIYIYISPYSPHLYYFNSYYNYTVWLFLFSFFPS